MQSEHLRIGTGEALVFLHGGGLGALMWRPHMMRLRERYASTAPELVTRKDDRTLEAIVATHLGLLESLLDSNTRTHVVGHSYGGGLALRAALRWPERIATLTLIEPTLPAVLRSANEQTALADLLGWRGEVRALRHDPAAAAKVFIDFWGGESFWRYLGPRQREAVAGWIADSDTAAWDTFYEAETIDLQAVAQIAIPTLVLSGDATPFPAKRACEVVGATIPGAVHKTISGGVGHMSPITHAHLVDEELIAHLGAHPV